MDIINKLTIVLERSADSVQPDHSDLQCTIANIKQRANSNWGDNLRPTSADAVIRAAEARQSLFIHHRPKLWELIIRLNLMNMCLSTRSIFPLAYCFCRSTGEDRPAQDSFGLVQRFLLAFDQTLFMYLNVWWADMNSWGVQYNSDFKLHSLSFYVLLLLLRTAKSINTFLFPYTLIFLWTLVLFSFFLSLLAYIQSVLRKVLKYSKTRIFVYP